METVSQQPAQKVSAALDFNSSRHSTPLMCSSFLDALAGWCLKKSSDWHTASILAVFSWLGPIAIRDSLELWKWVIAYIINTSLSTTTSANPPVFHYIFSFGKQRSLIANLIMLPAGWHQNQILAFPCLLTGVMRALDFSTKTMTKTRHPHRHECNAKLLLCCPIPSEALLPLDFFENSSLNPLLPEVTSYPQKLHEPTLALAQPNEFSFSSLIGLGRKALTSSWTNYLSG